jgi:hypothetical protein
MKKCTVCKESKSLDCFYNYKATKDGKSYRCKDCDDVARKKWRDNNPSRSKESVRGRNLKHKYGITLEEYKKMFKEQGECCLICRTTENTVSGDRFSKISFAVDHDHSSGKVRGILCNQCNRALGMFKDRKDILESAIKYLEKETH